jgi:zinc/manganese transport system substrate-binding protein
MFSFFEARNLAYRLAAAALFCATGAAHAALSVFACEPEWGALTAELAGPHASVFTATSAQQDPHRIEARPSLIARMRQADLVVCTGAELEVGWLPMMVEQAGNPRVLPGRPGYFEAASAVTLKDVPERLDRSLGDIHAAGNPHLHEDPRLLLAVAQALAQRLAAVDPANAADYAVRHARFAAGWRAHLDRWQQRATPLAGLPVVMQHGSPYLADWLGLQVVATLEPVPGADPSAAHLARVAARLAAQPARVIVRSAYHGARPAQWLASRTGLPVAVLPFTVGGSPQATDLVALYDDTLARLLAAIGKP